MAQTTKQAKRRKCNHQGACRTWVHPTGPSRHTIRKRIKARIAKHHASIGAKK